MDALFLGCGEAFDNDLLNTSVLVRTGSATLLLDCGYSIPPKVWNAVPDANEIDLIYISHAHADHYFGVPAVLGRMWEDGRTKPLTILSQSSVLEQIRAAMDLGYRGLSARFAYPIDFRPVTLSGTVEICNASFRFAETRHSVTNYAVSIETSRKTLVYSGDGMFTHASRDLASDADLLIHEAYSFDPLPIHGDIPSVIEMARTGEVNRLALVHVQRNTRRNERSRLDDAIAAAEGVSALLPEPGSQLHL